MKFKTTKSVTVKLPDGERAYSTRELACYVIKTSRQLGRSRDVAGLRLAARLLTAFDGTGGESAAVSDDEAALLKAAVEKPSAGWSSFTVKMRQPMGTNPDGSPREREVERNVSVAPLLLLPLIEEIVNS